MTPDHTLLPVQAIRKSAGCARLIAAMEAFYEELDGRIAARLPVCRNRGDCCRFASFGHRLFVTSVELAYFHAQHMKHSPGVRSRTDGSTPLSLPLFDDHRPNLCPYHQHGRCHARKARPVGCRVFFCESQSQGWQGELSEWALEQLKPLHEEFGVPYTYSEWLAALNALAGGDLP